MKTYRRHNCARTHRTHNTFAKCMFPRAAWISGNGEYATLAWCRSLTVMLHNDEESAVSAKRVIDISGCGGGCRGIGGHETVHLILGGRP